MSAAPEQAAASCEEIQSAQYQRPFLLVVPLKLTLFFSPDVNVLSLCNKCLLKMCSFVFSCFLGGVWDGLSPCKCLTSNYVQQNLLLTFFFFFFFSLQLLSQETVTKFLPKRSLIVELSETGSYKRSFHDPTGMTAAYVSEVHEHDGYLYLGSFRSPFICRLNLQHV